MLDILFTKFKCIALNSDRPSPTGIGFCRLDIVVALFKHLNESLLRFSVFLNNHDFEQVHMCCLALCFIFFNGGILKRQELRILIVIVIKRIHEFRI